MQYRWRFLFAGDFVALLHDANLESHAANELNAKQFEVGERQWEEDRDVDNRNRNSEQRPLIAVNSAMVHARGSIRGASLSRQGNTD